MYGSGTLLTTPERVTHASSIFRSGGKRFGLMEDSDNEEFMSGEMSEAAKCRIRNRALRKAREAAAMKEVMEEEYGRPLDALSPTSLVAVGIILFVLWRWLGS